MTAAGIEGGYIGKYFDDSYQDEDGLYHDEYTSEDEDDLMSPLFKWGETFSIDGSHLDPSSEAEEVKLRASKRSLGDDFNDQSTLHEDNDAYIPGVEGYFGNYPSYRDAEGVSTPYSDRPLSDDDDDNEYYREARDTDDYWIGGSSGNYRVPLPSKGRSYMNYFPAPLFVPESNVTRRGRGVDIPPPTTNGRSYKDHFPAAADSRRFDPEYKASRRRSGVDTLPCRRRKTGGNEYQRGVFYVIGGESRDDDGEGGFKFIVEKV
jgi:hypothetical protein